MFQSLKAKKALLFPMVSGVVAGGLRCRRREWCRRKSAEPGDHHGYAFSAGGGRDGQCPGHPSCGSGAVRHLFGDPGYPRPDLPVCQDVI